MEIIKKDTTTMKKRIFTGLGVKPSLKTEVQELKNTTTEMENRLEELRQRIWHRKRRERQLTPDGATGPKNRVKE